MNWIISITFTICLIVSWLYEERKTIKFNLELEQQLFRHSERWKIINKTSYYKSKSKRNIERLYFSYSQLNKHDLDIQEIFLESSEFETGTLQQVVELLFKTLYPATTFVLLAYLTTNNNLLSLIFKSIDSGQTSEHINSINKVAKNIGDILGPASLILMTVALLTLIVVFVNLDQSKKRKIKIKIHSDVIKKVRQDIDSSNK